MARRSKPKTGTPLHNARHEAFARLVAEGKTQADAYREVYPGSRKWQGSAVHENASKLRAKVGPRISELSGFVTDSTIADRIEILRRHTESARARHRPMSKFAAVDEAGRLRLALSRENLSLPCVKKLKVRTDPSAHGPDGTPAEIVEIEFHDHIASDQELSKLLKLYPSERVEIAADADTRAFLGRVLGAGVGGDDDTQERPEREDVDNDGDPIPRA